MSNKASTPASGPRRVHLVLTKVDPWSIMKMAFLLSVAIGIGMVVSAALTWFTLDSLEVFSKLSALLKAVNAESMLKLMAYVAFDRVMAMTTFFAVICVVLLTALATIGAFLYNIATSLVGGVHLTLSDE